MSDPAVLGSLPAPGSPSLVGPSAPRRVMWAGPMGAWGGRIITAVVVVGATFAAWRLRGTLGDGVSALAHLDATTIFAVAACWSTMVAARALVYRWAHPAGTMGQGLVLDQVNLATGNALPGGTVIGVATRYRVGRSFGQTPDGISLTMFAAGQAFSLGRWLLLGVVAGATLVGGHGSGVDVAVLVAAAGALLVGLALWILVSRDTRASRVVVRRAQLALDRVGRRFERVRDVPLVAFLDGIRDGARWILRERAVRLLLAGAVAGLAGAAIVVAVVHGVQGPSAPSVLLVLRTYLLARVASSIVPTPGNVGALEGALVTGLVATGADPGAAVAAVLVYRGVTFALPIATGALTYLGWRRWDRRRWTDEPGGPGPANNSLSRPEAVDAAGGTRGAEPPG